MSDDTKNGAPPAAQVLIVEDEVDHADVMADALRKPGHVSTVVTSVAGAIEELTHGSFDVIVTDLRMPDSGGADGVSADGGDAGLVVLRRAAELQPGAETVMVTARGCADGAGGLQGGGVRLCRETIGLGCVPGGREPCGGEGAGSCGGW